MCVCYVSHTIGDACFILQCKFDYTLHVKKLMHKTALIFTAVFLCYPFLLFGTTFNIICETNTGFETGLYNPKDSQYNQRSFFLAPFLEPAVTQPISSLWSAEISLPVSTTLRASADEDANARGGLTLLRDDKSNSFALVATASYLKQSGSLDPDQSLENMLYNFTAEIKNQGSVNTRFDYTLSKMDDINSERSDICNKLGIKLGFKPSDIFFPGLGIGLGLNKSNIKGYGYYEFNLTLYSTLLVGEKNTLIASLYANRRRYSAETASTIIGIKKKLGSVSNNFNPILMYSRSLTQKLDLDMSFNYSVYTTPLRGISSSSYNVSAGVSWSLVPL